MRVTPGCGTFRSIRFAPFRGRWVSGRDSLSCGQSFATNTRYGCRPRLSRKRGRKKHLSNCTSCRPFRGIKRRIRPGSTWRALQVGCAFSERGSRSWLAVRLTCTAGCARPHCALRSFLRRGYPRERFRSGSGCPPFLPTAGVPQGAHFVWEWGAPFFLRRGYPQGV